MWGNNKISAAVYKYESAGGVQAGVQRETLNTCDEIAGFASHACYRYKGLRSGVNTQMKIREKGPRYKMWAERERGVVTKGLRGFCLTLRNVS